MRWVPAVGSRGFTLGAQVIVRESQLAVFFRDGKGYDVFGPGPHTLSTLNLPLIGEFLLNLSVGPADSAPEDFTYLELPLSPDDPAALRDALR